MLLVSVHRSMQSAIKFSQIAAIFDVGDTSIEKEFMKSPHMYHCRRRIQYDIYIRFSNFVRELPNLAGLGFKPSLLTKSSESALSPQYFERSSTQASISLQIKAVNVQLRGTS